MSLCLFAGEYEKAAELSYGIALLMRDLPPLVLFLSKFFYFLFSKESEHAQLSYEREREREREREIY